jgi:hypothetical protein
MPSDITLGLWSEQCAREEDSCHLPAPSPVRNLALLRNNFDFFLQNTKMDHVSPYQAVDMEDGREQLTVYYQQVPSRHLS